MSYPIYTFLYESGNNHGYLWLTPDKIRILLEVSHYSCLTTPKKLSWNASDNYVCLTTIFQWNRYFLKKIYIYLIGGNPFLCSQNIHKYEKIPLSRRVRASSFITDFYFFETFSVAWKKPESQATDQ